MVVTAITHATQRDTRITQRLETMKPIACFRSTASEVISFMIIFAKVVIHPALPSRSSPTQTPKAP
jgi:hypothetical protein